MAPEFSQVCSSWTELINNKLLSKYLETEDMSSQSKCLSCRRVIHYDASFWSFHCGHKFCIFCITKDDCPQCSNLKIIHQTPPPIPCKRAQHRLSPQSKGSLENLENELTRKDKEIKIKADKLEMVKKERNKNELKIDSLQSELFEADSIIRAQVYTGITCECSCIQTLFQEQSIKRMKRAKTRLNHIVLEQNIELHNMSMMNAKTISTVNLLEKEIKGSFKIILIASSSRF